MTRHPRPVRAALAVLALAAGLGACTDAGPDETVPSAADLAPTPRPTDPTPATSQADDAGAPGGTASSPESPLAAPNPGASQKVRAEAFYACLMDEGFPAILEDYEGDQSRVGFEAPGPDALAILVEPEGQFRQLYEPDMNLGDKDFELRLQEAAVARAEELVEAAKASPYGMVVEFDGVDRTAEYVGCLESSAYTEPEIVRDWAAEAERDRKIADVSNEWAACAREHGVLGVKDAVVARDTHPVALLPPSISPAALRQLVEDCPPFDPEIEQGYVDAMNAAENPADVEYPHQPSIGFDVPGYDNQDDGAPPSEEIATQMDELEAILYADRSAYFESVGGVG